MTLDPNEPLVAGQTVLWSPTAQACWDQMKLYHGVHKIEFDQPEPITDVLNSFQLDAKATFPPGTVLFGGDDSPQRRAMIRAELMKKAGPNAAKLIGDFRPPGDISPPEKPEIPTVKHYRLKSALFVSCLAHAPKFGSGFSRGQGRRAFTCADGKKLMVRGFGAHTQDAAQLGTELVVLADDLQGGQVLRLPFLTQSEEMQDYLILARKPGTKTLGDAMKWARDTMKSPIAPQRAIQHQGRWWRYTAQLTPLDHFWMPNLKTTLVCDHTELINETYLSTPVMEDTFTYFWRIIEAQQMLSFKLNETGAMTQMVFKVSPDFESMSSGGAAGVPQTEMTPLAELPEWPKKFTFDQPFLAALWRKDAAWPYLACWVDSAEVVDLE
jgi:hypothetical protein